MNKFVPVLGVAAAMTLAGCKDPNYRPFGAESQMEPKIIDQTPAGEQTQTQEEPVQTVELTPAPGQEVQPPPTSVQADQPAPVEETTIYIVQRGDYLGKISKKYNVKIDAIKQLNNLKSDKILLGQKLKLPGKIDVGEQTVPEGAKAVKDAGAKTAKKPFEPYTGATVEYTVKSGDSLGKLAYGNGINVRQLKALNNLTSDKLKIGQKLKIPANDKAEKLSAAVPEPQSEVVVPEVALSATEEPAAPEAVTTTLTTTDAMPNEGTYVVQENEDLMTISVAMGVTPAVLREMNNLPEDVVLKAGQVLKVPADSQE